MAKEIERKFLIDLTKVGDLGEGTFIKQAYIPTQDHTAVRLRLKGEDAYLTIKGENKGLSRTEFDYPIPVSDALTMIEELCAGPVIEKTRYHIQYDNHLWEIDIFAGENQGLVVAEIELQAEDESFTPPAWVTHEVSHDPKYYNSSLLSHPFAQWPSSHR